jgi:hypothetical protein
MVISTFLARARSVVPGCLALAVGYAGLSLASYVEAVSGPLMQAATAPAMAAAAGSHTPASGSLPRPLPASVVVTMRPLQLALETPRSFGDWDEPAEH